MGGDKRNQRGVTKLGIKHYKIISGKILCVRVQGRNLENKYDYHLNFTFYSFSKKILSFTCIP